MDKLIQEAQERKTHKLYIDTFSDVKTKKEHAIISDADTQEVITIKDGKVTAVKMDVTQKNNLLERVEKEKQVNLESEENRLREKFNFEKAVKEDVEFDEWKLTQG